MKWRRDLSNRGITSISYPIIAQGLVIVAAGKYNSTNALIAFNEITGQQVWSATLGTEGSASTAYDNGKVFAANNSGLTKGFDAATGALLWSALLGSPTSPPTANKGTLFVNSGGTLYALEEKNGGVLWQMNVGFYGATSPAVAAGRVFTAAGCPEAEAFAAPTGDSLWQYSGSCNGNSLATPVVHWNKLYIGNSYFQPASGVILDVSTGNSLGTFDADLPPAFAGDLGVYFQSGTVRGVNLRSGNVLWSFAGNGDLTSAPAIINQTIYLGSGGGILYGLDFGGHTIWQTHVGSAIPSPSQFGVSTGLGAGDGLLVVPAGTVLSVYGN